MAIEHGIRQTILTSNRAPQDHDLIDKEGKVAFAGVGTDRKVQSALDKALVAAGSCGLGVEGNCDVSL